MCDQACENQPSSRDQLPIMLISYTYIPIMPCSSAQIFDLYIMHMLM